jgi:hypothetical protein
MCSSSRRRLLSRCRLRVSDSYGRHKQASQVLGDVEYQGQRMNTLICRAAALPDLPPSGGRRHFQPGVRPACSIHSCNSGRCPSSREVTLT